MRDPTNFEIDWEGGSIDIKMVRGIVFGRYANPINYLRRAFSLQSTPKIHEWIKHLQHMVRCTYYLVHSTQYAVHGI